MVRFPRLDDPEFPPKVDPLTRDFQDDQYEIDERARAQEGPGRFAAPRLYRRNEDVEDQSHPRYERPLVQEISTRTGNHARRLEELSQELFNRPWADLDDTQNKALWDEAEYRSGEHYRQIAPQGRSIGTRESTNVVSDREIAADAIIQAAQDLASQGWEPTRWDRSILNMPEGPQTNYYGQAREGQLPAQDGPPTLGPRVQQPYQSPVPGIAVDNSGQQYPVQNVEPLNAVQSIGAGAVLNVPLAATGFGMAAYSAVAHKFPELVDMLASGKFRTDDPEVISRAIEVAGIVTSGSFANRVAQEAGRARQADRVARTEQTGEPHYVPDDITLNINSTRDGRFNVDATVRGEQAVDLYVRHLRTRANDPNAVLQFGHAYIDEPWQRQGIASAVQQHLEAVTGKPFVPDNFLTEAAHARWQKLDPESVKGHVRRQTGDEVYYERSQAQDIIDQRPWTETPRMAEVRRAYAAGELESPLGPNGEFTLRGAQQPEPKGRSLISAVRIDGQNVYTGPIHMEAMAAARAAGERLDHGQVTGNITPNSPRGNVEQGFLTENGYFVSRDEALDLHGPTTPGGTGGTQAELTRRYGPVHDSTSDIKLSLQEKIDRAQELYRQRANSGGNRNRSSGEFTLGMGAATDRAPGGGARPRNLDPVGYYSHAEEAVGGMQQRGTPQQIWTSLESKGIKEPEIRQLGLDEAVLGPALAGSRRFVVDQTADLGRLRAELKELGTAEGQDRWIERRYGREHFESLENSHGYHAARDRQAELQRQIPIREQQLEGHIERHKERMQEIAGTRPSVNREDVLARIQENRPQVRETTYGVPRRLTKDEITEVRTAMAGPEKDWKLFIDELMNHPNWRENRLSAGSTARLIRDELDEGGGHLGAALNALRVHRGIETIAVEDIIKKLTGRSVLDISLGSLPKGATRRLQVAKATLDPANPTLRWRTLSAPGPESTTIDNLWRSIPEADSKILRGTWRYSVDELEAGLTTNQLNRVKALRNEHSNLINRIRDEERRGNFIDEHFEDTNIFGHYASSLQRLPEGGITLNVSQMQSSWFDKLRAGANIPRHSLVAHMHSWLDPALRRIIKDAVDQGATSITMPSADTVFRYNPPGEARAGLTKLYNEIIPRRMRVMMQELDKGYTSRGEKVDKLHGLNDPMKDYPAHNTYTEHGDATAISMQTGTIQRMGGEIENVRNGFQGNWTRFDLTPAITRHHRQGRGMRLQSAGPPIDGEDDGSQD